MTEGNRVSGEAHRHGLGILDWLQASFLTRLLTLIGPYAIILGVSGFLLDLDNMTLNRQATAWGLLTRDAPGNSGKIDALEYLNSHHPLAVPNPRRWGLPLGPQAPDDGLPFPKDWVLIANYGPFKTRTPLSGIDLSRARDAATGRWLEAPTYLRGVDLSDGLVRAANFAGADLYRARFARADLSFADLSGTQLFRADFTKATLFRADLSKAILERTSFSLANMALARLEDARALQTDFTGANLEDARFAGAYLDRAKLVNATLVGADFARASLATADLRGADLAHAKLADALGLTQALLASTCTDAQTTLPQDLRRPAPCVRDEKGRVIRDEAGVPLRAP